MKTEIYRFDYQSYASLATLPEEDQQLVRLAREACNRSHAPYSGFRVGAAARLSDGSVLSASNQESEVFPSGMCAERILLYQIQANHSDRKIEALAIAAQPSSGNVPNGECYPCGACRQVLVDTEKRQEAPMRVIMSGAESATVVVSARDLLPFDFSM